MKKLLCLFFICILLLSVFGCTKRTDTVTFYYPRAEILYGQEDGVIAAEERDVSGREKDFSYLMMLYLEGPISQELDSPFPAETAIEQLELRDDVLHIRLSEPFSRLEGMDYTIACCCIARTCFGLYDTETVEITCGTRTMILDRNTVAWVDAVDTTDPS